MCKEYEALIKPMMSASRYRHSLCVAKEAQKLAKRYGEDPKRARLAGLLHDICKDLPRPEQLQWIENSGIILDSVLLNQPQLWHGIAGSVYLRSELNMEDDGILNAVRYHTSARANMCLLEKIIYVADYTSEDRKFAGVQDMRDQAKVSLESAMLEALSYTMKMLVKKQSAICRDTYEAYNSLVMG